MRIMTEDDDFRYAVSSCLECHLAPLSLTSLRTRHSSIPNEQYETESGLRGQGREAASAWDREEHNVFFVNKSYHQQRKGGSMVVWSTDGRLMLRC